MQMQNGYNLPALTWYINFCHPTIKFQASLLLTSADHVYVIINFDKNSDSEQYLLHSVHDLPQIIYIFYLKWQKSVIEI